MGKQTLFIYSTLKSTLVQLALFGRTLSMKEGYLDRYETVSRGDGNYLLFPKDGAQVLGYLAEISEDEMKVADSWKDETGFIRKEMPIISQGKEVMAWVYVDGRNNA